MKAISLCSQRVVLIGAAISLLLLSSGCSSLMCTRVIAKQPTPFAGVLLDIELASDKDEIDEATRMYAWVDFPLSAAFDVSVLPLQMLCVLVQLPGWGSPKDPYEQTRLRLDGSRYTSKAASQSPQKFTQTPPLARPLLAKRD